MRIRLALIAVICLGLVLPPCLGTEEDVASAGGVQVRRVATLEPGVVDGAGAALPGDFVVTTDSLRALVGGRGRRGSQRGRVLELLSLAGEPARLPGALALRLRVAGESHPVALDVIDLVARGGTPGLRLAGVTTVNGRDVGLELNLTANDGIIGIGTHVRLLEGPPLDDVAAALELDWQGAEPFAPGHGFLVDETPVSAPLIGAEGVGGAVAVAADVGPLAIAPHVERHGESAHLVHVELSPPGRALARGEALVWRAALAVSNRELSDAVAALTSRRGETLERIPFELPYRPAGARVTISDSLGRPWMIGHPDAAGKLRLARLVPDDVVAVATAFGHASSDEVVVTGTPTAAITLHIPRGGRIRVDVRDERTALPLPARIRLRGLGGAKTPDLGPKHRAAGAGNALVTLHGEAIIPVSPGRYRVQISHGPEWTLHEQDVEVTETYRPDVLARLDHVVRPRGWVAADLHLHAAPSDDSEVSLRDRLITLLAEGVRFAVPTDHNHVTDYGPTAARMGLDGFATVPGVEVTTWAPAFGHFNAYPVTPDPSRPGNGAPPFEGLSPGELFTGMRSAGDEVIVQVNHPRLEPDIGYFDHMHLDASRGTASPAYSADYDVLEVWNGYDLSRPERFEAVFAEWLWLVSRGKRVVAVGNSDSHQVNYHWAGYPRSYVWTEDGMVEPEALLHSLRAGRVMVTSGPMLQVTALGRGPGETLYTEPGVLPLRVQVQAPPWMDVSSVQVFVGREPALVERVREWGEPQPVVRFDRVLELELERETFVVVMARGEHPMDAFLGRAGVLPIAFTNPIWIRFGDPPVDGGLDASDAEPRP